MVPTDNAGLPGVRSRITITRLITYDPYLITDDRLPHCFARHEWLPAYGQAAYYPVLRF